MLTTHLVAADHHPSPTIQHPLDHVGQSITLTKRTTCQESSWHSRLTSMTRVWANTQFYAILWYTRTENKFPSLKQLYFLSWIGYWFSKLFCFIASSNCLWKYIEFKIASICNLCAESICCFFGREGMWRTHSESREQDSAATMLCWYSICFGVWLLVIGIAALVWESLAQQELNGRLKLNITFSHNINWPPCYRNTSQKTQTLIELYLLKHNTLQKERLHIKSKEIWSKKY